MIKYTIMLPRTRCVESCGKYGSSCTHDKEVYWEPNGKLYDKPGPALPRLAAYQKHSAKLGGAWMAEIDISTLKPWLNDAESAAYKIGGWDAVRRMKQQQEREQAKLDKQLELENLQARKVTGNGGD